MECPTEHYLIDITTNKTCPIESQTAEVIIVEKKLFVDWHIFSEEKPKKLLTLFAMWRIIKT